MLLAVFVAHDYRPWLSVAGTCAAGFGLRQEWIRELVNGRTTVCPLWLLGKPFRFSPVSVPIVFLLEARPVEFFHFELVSIDARRDNGH